MATPRTHPALRSITCRWPDYSAILFTVMITLTGLIGFFDDLISPMSGFLGAWVFVCSVGAVVSGLITTAGILLRYRYLELVGMFGIAVYTLSLAFISTNLDSRLEHQTVWRLLGAVFCTLALAGTRWQRGISRAEVKLFLPDVLREHSR